MLLRLCLFFLILTFGIALQDCAASFSPSCPCSRLPCGAPLLPAPPFLLDDATAATARRYSDTLENQSPAQPHSDTARRASQQPAKTATDTLNAQQDSAQAKTFAKADTAMKADSVAKPDSLVWRLRPELVALGAAALPGFGQIYNRAYWKLPIVYGLFAWFGYNYFAQQRQYLEFRQRYEEDLAKTPVPPSAEANRRFREFYREQRDETGVYILLVYLASIVDAYVDAHLFGFDVSDDLSQRAPTPTPIVPIFTIKLKF